MADDSLTHKDLARALGVSETTIKSYRRKFPGCLPVVTRSKPLRFAPVSLEVCRAIREGFAAGLSVEAVRKRLAEAYAWCAKRPARPDATAASETGDGTGDASASADPGVSGVLDGLASAVRSLAETQERILARLEAMGRRLDDLAATGGAAGPAGTARQAETGTAAPAGPAKPDKVVRIRTRQGSVERYGLSRMAAPEGEESGHDGTAAEATDARGAEATGAEAGPSAAFLGLPMVIRGGPGEFLGIAGREGHLSIDGFRELMRRKAGADAPLPVRWERLDEAWVMHLGPAPATNGEGLQPHTLHLERTTTPRGNEVVWLKSMVVADDVMPDAFLHDFLRRLRKEFD